MFLEEFKDFRQLVQFCEIAHTRMFDPPTGIIWSH